MHSSYLMAALASVCTTHGGEEHHDKDASDHEVPYARHTCVAAFHPEVAAHLIVTFDDAYIENEAAFLLLEVDDSYIQIAVVSGFHTHPMVHSSLYTAFDHINSVVACDRYSSG